MHEWLANLPKIELHLHIEGTLEPELAFELAQRHQIALPYPSVEALREAYNFADLQSFLDLYYQCAEVLRDEDDFYRLTMAYLERCHTQAVTHVEIFFDPQTHTARGIPMSTVIEGIERALKEGETRFGISSQLILCILRHLDEEDALATLNAALPYRDRIVGIGLDSGEQGNPPSKFTRAFDFARAQGWKIVAHAGEEGPADYIWQALKLLKVDRIDHGVRCVEDPSLVAHLRDINMPLTVCPLSNTRLRVFHSMAEHNLKTLLDQGLRVTLNSDDPAYFGGYMLENMLAVQEALNLTQAQWRQLTKNAIDASFIDHAHQQRLHAQLDAYPDTPHCSDSA
ncbi:adenosine deaminase [Terasakiispira papahanaumokuakeensis]|uniref:Adenine deaminase n=1 Tax=Terasakiispira papahanaumokuakeensis TaxID=197479 RepID=A0A1E2VBH3_9GAMM|nr:adenosine deaminase [Terasakiispira papahanaumokuakeensis]ODC04358.1 adenosine deaminase [Terasakiispira papahanaumokuakeensis]